MVLPSKFISVDKESAKAVTWFSFLLLTSFLFVLTSMVNSFLITLSIISSFNSMSAIFLKLPINTSSRCNAFLKSAMAVSILLFADSVWRNLSKSL